MGFNSGFKGLNTDGKTLAVTHSFAGKPAALGTKTYRCLMYKNACILIDVVVVVGGSISARVHVTLLSATRLRPKLSRIPALDRDNCTFLAEVW
jgi:hypothetical protein